VKTSGDEGQKQILLFCFPFAGGSASAFRNFTAASGNAPELIPLEYPAHGARRNEPPAEDMVSLVGDILQYISLTLRSPYALFGHSLGAHIAFETTCKLLRLGYPPPVALLVSGACPPDRLTFDGAHRLGDEEFLGMLSEYGAIHEEILRDRELLSIVLPVVRRDFELLAECRYTRCEPLPVPILAFGGLNDSKVSIADILAWSRFTQKSFRVRFYSGKHFFLFTNIRQLAADIEGQLNQLCVTGETRQQYE
jgi:surfactin synthase thioesterase subunit